MLLRSITATHQQVQRSREQDTNQAHGCTTWFCESHCFKQSKAPDMAWGEPHIQGECWHTESRTVSLMSPEQALPWSTCSALYMAKLLTYQHLFSFYTKQTKALQGSTTSLLTFQFLREKLSFGFVSVTFGCVRKECIAYSLKQSHSPVQRFPANRGRSWRKETWDHCTQSHLLLFSHIYRTPPGF